MTSPFTEQIGGAHYKNLKIQPAEYAFANNLDFLQGTVVKYVTRWKSKGGVEDLQKAMHVLQLYIDLQTRKWEGEVCHERTDDK